MLVSDLITFSFVNLILYPFPDTGEGGNFTKSSERYTIPAQHNLFFDVSGGCEKLWRGMKEDAQKFDTGWMIAPGIAWIDC